MDCEPVKRPFRGAALPMSRYAVRRIPIVKSKRPLADGLHDQASLPARICLLELFVPGAGTVQRRVIEVREGDQLVWREYDVLRSFADESEAAAFAAENDIDDFQI